MAPLRHRFLPLLSRTQHNPVKRVRCVTRTNRFDAFVPALHGPEQGRGAKYDKGEDMVDPTIVHWSAIIHAIAGAAHLRLELCRI